MKALSKIIKKNNKQKLGRYNRELIIRFAMKKNKIKQPTYQLV